MDMQIRLGLDCCASVGTVIRSSHNLLQDLPFIGRYKEPGCVGINFLNQDLSLYCQYVNWVFPPRRLITQVYEKILSSPHRGMYICLLLQHNELPFVYPMLKKASVEHRIYSGTGVLLRPNKKKKTFVQMLTGPVVHVFKLSPVKL